MSSSSDNPDSVQKLLRLKRYEQPPPRYFNEFSGRVLARIEAGEGRASWWEKFGFDLRPAFAAAAGMAACVLVVYGVATTDGDLSSDGITSVAGASLPAALDPAPSGLAAVADPTTANSTNPVANYGTPIDRTVFGAEVMRASYPRR